jgi:hypothetical protein
LRRRVGLSRRGAEQRRQHREQQHRDRAAGDEHGGVGGGHLSCRDGHCRDRHDDRETRGAVQPHADALADARPGSARVTVEPGGQVHRTTADDEDQADEQQQVGGILRNGLRIDRHARGDEEHRDQEAEGEAVQLQLEPLVALRKGSPQDEARGECTEDDVEVELRSQCDERHQQQHRQSNRRLAGGLGAHPDQVEQL